MVKKKDKLTLTKEQKLDVLNKMKKRLRVTKDGPGKSYYCSILSIDLDYDANKVIPILKEVGLVEEYHKYNPKGVISMVKPWHTSEFVSYKGVEKYCKWKKDMINNCIKKLSK